MVHPDRPAPVEAPSVQFKSLVVDEGGVPTSYIALTRQDAAKFATWMEQILTFIKKEQDLLCYYRKDQNEPICALPNDNMQ